VLLGRHAPERAHEALCTFKVVFKDCTMTDNTIGGPSYQPHDFKLRHCLTYASADWNLHRKPKTPTLKPVADFFTGRCARLRLLMCLPANIGDIAMQLQRAIDRAEFEVTGAVSKNDDASTELRAKIEARWREILDEMVQEKRKLRDSPDWDEYARQSLGAALLPAQVISADPRTVAGLRLH
jgi:hypothetical protein